MTEPPTSTTVTETPKANEKPEEEPKYKKFKMMFREEKNKREESEERVGILKKELRKLKKAEKNHVMTAICKYFLNFQMKFIYSYSRFQ